MGCCYKCTKYVLFVINIFFSIVGLLLVGAGVYIKLNYDTISDDTIISLINHVAISIIIFGSVVFLIAFCGCCGAVTEQPCLLITFSIIMLLLAAANIVIIVLINNNTTILRNQIAEVANNVFESDKNTFQTIEYMLECCGTTGPGSYANETSGIPLSCCSSTNIRIDSSIIPDSCTLHNAFTDGCTAVMERMLMNIANNAQNIFIINAVCEFVQAFLAIYLSCSISKTRREKRRPVTSNNNAHNNIIPRVNPDQPSFITINSHFTPGQ